MIRRGTAADRPRLRTLQSELAEPSPELLDLGLGGAGVVLVAERDGAVAGYALAIPGDADASPAAVFVAELVVAPAHRRSGLGSDLLDAVAAATPAYDELRLTARVSDERALAFYDAVGFERMGRLPDHFADGDGWLLVR
jgi:ribosomal-protein-alanine N-acetyltransferase